MKTVGVVTVGRSDYGIYLPLLRQLQDDAELKLHLIVAGMHLCPEFGLTIQAIEADGFPIGDRVEMNLSSDSPCGLAKTMGLGTIGFAQVYDRNPPDILVVLGDRFEMLAAALAALPFKIPVAHIHGGELSEGAIDDAIRHCLSKLSHLHFVATEEYARRVEQLGEEPWRIVVSGALSLDNLHAVQLLSREQLEQQLGLPLQEAPILITYHPVTLEYERVGDQVDELLAALEQVEKPLIFTSPNADTGSRTIARKIRAFVDSHPSAWLVENLGTQAYFSLMAVAAAMVGNSSSGLIEAPSFGLPVVNVGSRQDGRIRGANVIDVGCRRQPIVEAITRALSPGFRALAASSPNPYSKGGAAATIVETLKKTELNDRLLRKRFHDLAPLAPSAGKGRKP